MTNSEATYRAEEFIKLMLQYQPNLFGSSPLNGVEQAKQVAQALAALRAELIAQLTPQQ
jgi:hypothetical protein